MVRINRRRAPLGASILALLLAAAGAPAQVLSSNLLFTSVQPCRLFDTRPRFGGTGPIAANTDRTFNVVGDGSADFAGQGGQAGGCGIPGFFAQPTGPRVPQAQAVAVDLVALSPRGTGDLRAWATDQPRPDASVLYYAALPGLNLAEQSILPLRQDQQGADVTLRADVSGTGVAGYVVGYFASNVDTNLALGAGSFQSAATGTNNVALGPSTLASDLSGNFNTGIGGGALRNNTSGTLNTGAGSGSLAGLDGAGDNLAVGAGSMHDHFNMGNGNVAIGAEALLADHLGTGNVAIGFQAGSTPDDSHKLYIGGADGNPPLIYGDFSTGTVKIVSGAGAPAAPQSTLEVQGTLLVDALGSGAVCAGAGGVLTSCSPSDARLKTDVVDLGRELDLFSALAGLRGVAFGWDTSQARAKTLGPRREIGLLAQEVERVLPHVVSTQPDGYEAVDYARISAFLIEVVKSEQRALDSHESALDRQRQGIEALQQRLRQLRERNGPRGPTKRRARGSASR